MCGSCVFQQYECEVTSLKYISFKKVSKRFQKFHVVTRSSLVKQASKQDDRQATPYFDKTVRVGYHSLMRELAHSQFLSVCIRE
jgi:hypothetical protein